MSNAKYPAAYGGRQSTFQTFTSAGVADSTKKDQAADLVAISKDLRQMACRYQDAYELCDQLDNLSGRCEELAIEIASESEKETSHD